MKNSLIIDCFAGGGGASVGIEMATGHLLLLCILKNQGRWLLHNGGDDK